MNIEQLKVKAEQNDPEAQARLSLAYLTGENIKQDYSEGWKLYEKASQHPDILEKIITPESVSNYPEICRSLIELNNFDKTKSNAFLIALAESGDGEAERALGIACSQRRSLPDEYCNDEQAEKWFTRAVESGVSDAHRDLFELYSKPKSALHDPIKAFSHLQQIIDDARIGDTFAIGNMLYNGIGVEKDEIAGLTWLYISACRLEEGPAWVMLHDIFDVVEPSVYQEAKQRAHDWMVENAYAAKWFGSVSDCCDPITQEKIELKFDDTSSVLQASATDIQNEVIKKWHEYCEDSSSHDNSTFQTLLTEDPKLSFEQLKDIFKYYKPVDTLIQRFTQACDCRFGRSSKALSMAELESAAREDLLLKYSIAKSSEHFTDIDAVLSEKIISDARVEVAADHFTFLTADSAKGNPNDLLPQLLNDEIGQYFNVKEITGYYGLHQALYGVLSDDTLMYHVLSAFSKDEMHFSAYLALRNGNTRYTLVDGRLVLYTDESGKL